MVVFPAQLLDFIGLPFIDPLEYHKVHTKFWFMSSVSPLCMVTWLLLFPEPFCVIIVPIPFKELVSLFPIFCSPLIMLHEDHLFSLTCDLVELRNE